MNRLPIILAVAVLLTFAGARQLTAQNLLTNPHFDTDISGWGNFPSAFDATLDVNGSPTSGSLKWINDNTTPSTSSGGPEQCLGGIVPLASYHLRVHVFVPPGQAATGSGNACIAWFSSSCLTLMGFLSETCTPFVGVAGSWTPTDILTTAPAGATSGHFVFSVFKVEAGGSLQVNFDDAVFEGPPISPDLGITVDDGVSTATPGGTVTYTIVAGNAGPDADPAVTVTDTFPPVLSGCSVTSVAAGGATGNDPGPTAGQLADSGISLPPGSSVTYTAICTLGTSPGPTLANTATVAGAGTDPDPTNNSATDSDAVGASLAATKTVSAPPYVVGGAVTYTIVLTNGGGGQADNPGPELVDALPAGLALVSASASSGTVASNMPINSVAWNGSLVAGGTVTITIQATILPVAAGQTIGNQASIAFDANGDGTNEATGVTDDPTVAGGQDATLIQVARSVVQIPTLGPLGFALLLLALALSGLLVLRAARAPG